MAASLTALLALLPTGRLLAQQPGYWQNPTYTGPYGPSTQHGPTQPGYGYAQPGYSQPRSYAPQSYTPQSYAPQGYSQPAYPPGGQSYSQPGYSQPGYVQQNYAQSGDAQESYVQQPVQRQALDAAQLEQLAAPIALYPDTLVAQVLAASTYPAQVLEADRWLRAQGGASPYDIAGGADAQSWDPSVKALTAFPQVLSELARNLAWTTDLGNAYYNQPQDLLEAVQVLRQRAQAAGSLQSTPQEAVSYDQGAIELGPVNPQLVYVPAYDPWTVYGDPVTPYPGFSLLSALGSFFTSGLGSSVVRFGLGTALSAFAHTSWGWLGWGLSWLSHAVLFHQSAYASQSASLVDWGLPSGGLRAYMGRGAAWIGNGAGGSTGSSARLGTRPGSGYGAAQGFVRGPHTGLASLPGRTPVLPAPAHPAEEAYNRVPAPIVRSQGLRPQANTLRPSYGVGYSAGAAGNGVRAGSVYANSYGNPPQGYRAPAPARGYQGRPSSGFAGQSFAGTSGYAGAAGKEQHGGGFHLFGGGDEAKYKEPKYSEPKYKEPKYKEPKFSQPKFKEPKMASGHSGGGDHGSGRHHG